MSASAGVLRARLGLLAAVVASLVALASWFPLGELLRQRGELASLSSAVVSVTTRNDALASDVHALGAKGEVETIAHSEFGLVRPGQLSFVIVPTAGSSSGSAGLRATTIPAVDLVADPPAIAPQAATPASGPGFLSRFLSRLEFWHRGG